MCDGKMNEDGTRLAVSGHHQLGLLAVGTQQHKGACIAGEMRRLVDKLTN